MLHSSEPYKLTQLCKAQWCCGFTVEINDLKNVLNNN